MSEHWTYKASVDPDADLAQGDILLPTDELERLFARVHPHFCDQKYVGFMVLTQTCDLVRRKDNCSARYINVGVIRQLDTLLPSLLGTVCKQIADGFFLKDSMLEGKKLLSRIFNQNEQSLGLFYLHPDADVGIGKSSVALLRVSVAFRVEHYQCLVEARRGRLRPEFGNKLGWLVGNIFSRVGTPDWSDQPDGKKVVDQMTTQLLKEHAVWVADADVQAARGAGINLEALPSEKIEPTLEQHRPAAPREQILSCAGDVVSDVIREVLGEARADMVQKIVNRLRNDARFSEALKQARRR